MFHVILTHRDYRLNQLQLKFLEELRMIEIMKALQTFVIWLQEGMYNFSSLPVTLKEDLYDCHIQELEQATEVAVSDGNSIIANDSVSMSVYIAIYIYMTVDEKRGLNTQYIFLTLWPLLGKFAMELQFNFYQWRVHFIRYLCSKFWNCISIHILQDQWSN